MTATSQLAGHAGARVSLAGRHGPIAAIRGAAPTDGPVLGTALLVPGYTGSKEDFAPLLDDCSAAGIRALAVDLPGQHESPGPDDESAYLPLPLGEVVADLVAAVGADTRVVLLGHSYGGLVARAAVLAGAEVAGLTLLDSGPGCLPDGARRAALFTGMPLLRSTGSAAVFDLRERILTETTGQRPARDELWRFLRHRFVSSVPAGLLGMAQGLCDEPDRTDELAGALHRRSLPGLVAAGENDDAWSVPSQREMAERLNTPFALVEAAGHSPNTENPRRLLEILLPAWRHWLG